MSGCIYIMTNPALKGMVKIGYASDVERRRRELSTTALPYEYEVYAIYNTKGNIEDKKLHKLIDQLNPDLRVNKNREFFVMEPEDAYQLLEAIATISGTLESLRKIKPSENSNIVRRPSIDFYACGLHDGDELVYNMDANIKVTVCGNRKVLYNDELRSLSSVAQELLNSPYQVQGPLYFSYKGQQLIDIAKETQWK